MLNTPLRIAALALCAGLVACAGTARPDLVIHESTRGVVALERIPDKSIQAAHPVKLDPAVVSAALRGLHVKDSKSALDELIMTNPHVMRVFSEDDIRFLAPLVVDALATARADQLVRFTTVQSGALTVSNERVGAAAGSSGSVLDSRQERTGGTLYVYGLSMYVSLTDFRHRREQPDTINGPNRRYAEATGVDSHDVVFVPESAVRPDSYKKSGWFGSDA